MNLTNILEKRYSTKSFDKNKKIAADIWNQIEDSLRLAPSSTNIQPWHFIIASTTDGKERLIKGTEGIFDFNTEKIRNASHAVLFCSKLEIQDNYLQKVLSKEELDGRFKTLEAKDIMHAGRQRFVRLHKDRLHDLKDWMEKQVYINVGNALLSAAVLDVDAVPMEGIDREKLDQEFGLADKGLSPAIIIAFGYRSDEDYNSKLPKSRLNQEDIFNRI